jgi:hypothetical protein
MELVWGSIHQNGDSGDVTDRIRWSYGPMPDLRLKLRASLDFPGPTPPPSPLRLYLDTDTGTGDWQEWAEFPDLDPDTYSFVQGALDHGTRVRCRWEFDAVDARSWLLTVDAVT